MLDPRQIWTVGWLNENLEIIIMTDPSKEPPRIILLHRKLMQRDEEECESRSVTPPRLDFMTTRGDFMRQEILSAPFPRICHLRSHKR